MRFLNVLRRSKQKEVNQYTVATASMKNAYSQDINQDGTPDFLQRPDIPSMVKTVADTVLAHVDAQKELEAMMMGWAGYVYDDKNSMYKPQLPPLMNYEGVLRLGNYIKSIINKLTMNSNISEDWAHKQTEFHSSTIAEWLSDYVKPWGLSESDLTPISEQCDSFMFLVLSRAINDKQRDHDTQRMKLTGSVSDKPENKEKVGI